MSINGKPFFMAQYFRVGAEQRSVDRSAERQAVHGQEATRDPRKQFEGRIEKIREVKVKGGMSPHKVGVLRTNEATEEN